MDYHSRLDSLREQHSQLIGKVNIQSSSNGIWTRYQYPVLTAEHAPLYWRYDLNPETNPLLLERFGINGVFNAGAIKIDGKYLFDGIDSVELPRVWKDGGDGVSDAADTIGLVAPRVMLCAAHQAHTVLRILAGEYEV
mgnify:CR=1 FL=1